MRDWFAADCVIHQSVFNFRHSLERRAKYPRVRGFAATEGYRRFEHLSVRRAFERISLRAASAGVTGAPQRDRRGYAAAGRRVAD